MDTGFDPTKSLQPHERQAVEHYFAVESKSMDAEIFKKKHFKTLRDHVVHLIQIHSRSENENFDACIPYLAVNYFDRFISRNPLPIIGDKDLNYRALILSLCCLSLAWKMENHFSIITLLRNIRLLNFDRKHILEIEVKILNGLEWRMCSVTALCFVRYFMVLASHPNLSFRRISEIIIQAQGDIIFTQFKPSVLAASAMLTAITFENRDETDIYREGLLKGELVQLNEIEVISCTYSMIGMGVCKGIVNTTPRMRTDGASTSGSATAGESNVGCEDSAKLPYTRRPWKKIVSEVPKPKQTQVPVSTLLSAESKEKDNLNLDFELKWITNDNQDEGLLMTLDPALFLPEDEAKRSRIRTWLKAKFCMSI